MEIPIYIGILFILCLLTTFMVWHRTFLVSYSCVIRFCPQRTHNRTTHTHIQDVRVGEPLLLATIDHTTIHLNVCSYIFSARSSRWKHPLLVRLMLWTKVCMYWVYIFHIHILLMAYQEWKYWDHFNAHKGKLGVLITWRIK